MAKEPIGQIVSFTYKKEKTGETKKYIGVVIGSFLDKLYVANMNPMKLALFVDKFKSVPGTFNQEAFYRKFVKGVRGIEVRTFFRKNITNLKDETKNFMGGNSL